LLGEGQPPRSKARRRIPPPEALGAALPSPQPSPQGEGASKNASTAGVLLLGDLSPGRPRAPPTGPQHHPPTRVRDRLLIKIAPIPPFRAPRKRLNTSSSGNAGRICSLAFPNACGAKKCRKNRKSPWIFLEILRAHSVDSSHLANRGKGDRRNSRILDLFPITSDPRQGGSPQAARILKDRVEGAPDEDLMDIHSSKTSDDSRGRHHGLRRRYRSI